MTVVPGACGIVVNIDNPTITSLALRESPTYNSPRLKSIPNGANLVASYRLETTTGSNPDIWYQVAYDGFEGWIGARISGTENVNNVNCGLPAPYPPSWIALAQIDQSELLRNGVCAVDNYLRTEEPALVMARVAYAEAAIYMPEPLGDTTGGIVYEDAIRIAWIIRMNALMGLPNYGSKARAGDSVTINEMVLTQGAYQPIDVLKTELTNNGCIPSNVSANQPNVLRMVYPQNASNKAELFQLYRIYQTIRISIVDAFWSDMPLDIRGFEQFKGAGINDECPSGDDNLMRPGSLLSWAANQPYPPKFVFPYLGSKPNQARKTCYQDAYHLDDLFLAALNTAQPDLPQISPEFISNRFPLPVNKPVGYCVQILVNPNAPNDIYPLAQLTGINGQPCPTGQCP